MSRNQKELQLQIASAQESIAESQTCNHQEAVLLSEQGTRIKKKIDIATCLMARDYKGFGNQAANGVIEKWQK